VSQCGERRAEKAGELFRTIVGWLTQHASSLLPHQGRIRLAPTIPMPSKRLLTREDAKNKPGQREETSEPQKKYEGLFRKAYQAVYNTKC
jgi:hypothetical protein